jgi:hypothetical protein
VRVTNISVELEKRANDRDYGSERAVAQLAAALDPSDDPEMSLRILVDLARASVESDLKRSANLHVRRALIRQLRLCNRCGDPLPDEEESYMHPACSDAERAERQAKYDELKAKEAERWAQSNANAEERALAGVAVGDDDDDDGDLPL